MSRKIQITEPAAIDISEAVVYLAAKSAPAAKKLRLELISRCKLLAGQPGIGRRRDDLLPGLRSSVIGHYVMLYRFDDETLEVVRFLHGSRDIASEMQADED